MIKAIETKYNGYRFRSRLEARWAVFFDACGIEYQYEPQGFEMEDGTKYLPDFYLPNMRTPFFGKDCAVEEITGLYIEVKGVLNDIDAHKVSKFSNYHPILIIGDIPKNAFDNPNWKDSRFWSHQYTYGSAYSGVKICKDDDGEFYLGTFDADYGDAKKLNYAYEKARQARFEHGECGGEK